MFKNIKKNNSNCVNNKSKIFYFVTGVISLLLFIMIFIKSYNMSFTHDEAVSYFFFIEKNTISSLFFLGDAGNHFLNTFFSKINAFLFGKSELVLRMHNSFAFIIYAFFSILILNEINNLVVKFTGFIILIFNPYLIDFFSLYRGYGLVLTFTIISLYFLLKFIITNNNKYIFLTLLAGSLTIFSNLSSLNYYLCLLVTILIIIFLFNIKNINFKNKIDLFAKTDKKIFFKYFLFLSVFVLFILITLINFDKNVIEIIKTEMKEKFYIKFEGNNINFNNIKIFKKTVKNNNVNDIEEIKYNIENNTAVIDKYCRKLGFLFENNELDNITNININFNKINYNYTPHKIISDFNKEYINKQVLYILPDYISLPESKIPFLKNIINWKGDDLLIKYIINSLIKLFFYLVIGVIILLIFLFLIYIISKLLICYNFISIEQFTPIFKINVILFIILSYPIYILKKGGTLWYGGKKIEDTISTLIGDFFYKKNYFFNNLPYLLIIISILIFIFLFIFMLLKKRINKFHLINLSLILIIFFTFLSLILQNLLFKTPFLINRTAIFLVPIFSLFYIILIYNISEYKFLKIISYFVIIIISIFTIYHFISCFNFKYVLEFDYDANTKDMIKDIELEYKRNNQPINLALNYSYYPASKYYISVRKLDFLKLYHYDLAPEEEIIKKYKSFEYLYLNNINLLKNNNINYKIINQYLPSNNYLVKILD